MEHFCYDMEWQQSRQSSTEIHQHQLMSQHPNNKANGLSLQLLLQGCWELSTCSSVPAILRHGSCRRIRGQMTKPAKVFCCDGPNPKTFMLLHSCAKCTCGASYSWGRGNSGGLFKVKECLFPYLGAVLLLPHCWKIGLDCALCCTIWGVHPCHITKDTKPQEWPEIFYVQGGNFQQQ